MLDLSKAIGTSESAIGMYESGQRVPRDEIKIRIAEHFTVPVESIFFRGNNTNRVKWEPNNS